MDMDDVECLTSSDSEDCIDNHRECVFDSLEQDVIVNTGGSVIDNDRGSVIDIPQEEVIDNIRESVIKRTLLTTIEGALYKLSMFQRWVVLCRVIRKGA